MRKQRVDIIFGIPSFNEADNIAFVAKQASIGLQKYFRGKRCMIVNIDNHSSDGTRDAFLGAKTKVAKCYVTTPKGVRGKGNNFKNLFRLAQNLKAKAVVVVDADIKSITPEWVKLFVAPIFEGFDFVVPVYHRNRYDATITNHICFPVVYGLFGKNIRHPIAGDFAFSGKLNSYYLKRRWHQSTKQFGIDIFMTSNAIFGGFKICNAFLGTKVHKPSQPKLGAMFTQVVRVLFINIINRFSQWRGLKEVKELTTYGQQYSIKPQHLNIDLEKIKSISVERFDEYWYILQQYLSRPLFTKLDHMYAAKELAIDHKVWAHIMYDLIAAYANTMDKGEVIECLKALYFGRIASFVESVQEMNDDEVEHEIIKQARYFHQERSKLIRRLDKIRCKKQKK